MESKCGLLQGGGCPSYLFADLCLEAKVNSLNLYSQRKLTPCASLFHGKPWMSQCWDNEPWGSKGRDGGEGTLGHLHIILFWIAREEIWEEIWEGIWEQGGVFLCWRHGNQTNFRLEKPPLEYTAYKLSDCEAYVSRYGNIWSISPWNEHRFSMSTETL